MNLSSTAARRPVGTAMLYFSVLVVGVVASRQLAVDLMPKADMPQVSVSTVYDGVAPEEIETLITRPIERSLSTIDGLEQLNSTSSEGMSRVSARFSWGKDLDEVVNDIREQLDRVRQMLPEDAEPPSVFKFNLSDMPIAQLGLSGSGDVRRVRYLADEVISRRLERVPGVASAGAMGGREREIQVLLDQSRLSALGVTPREVSSALASENRNVSAGDMLETNKEVLVRTLGEYTSVEDIADVVVATRDGRSIFVRDVGEVRDGFRELKNELWIDGAAGMRMYVQKQSGANTVEVMEALKREISSIERDYAGQVELRMLFDGSTFIQQSVDNVKRGALFGALLAVAVLLLFLRDLRATAVVATAIPISVLATVALMYFNGYTLNVVSLGGIALGIGMLVDSAIVVLENIFRHRKEGKSKLDAAIDGAREVTPAIIAGTLTTIAVFVPVVFIQGFAGIFFKEMAITVSFALLCALIVSMTLIPAAAARWLGGRQLRLEGNRVLVAATEALRGLDAWYAARVRRAIEVPWRVILGAVVLLVSSFFLAPMIGFELMPEADEGRINASFELPVGTPIEQTMRAVQEIELAVRGALLPGELDNLVTTAGPENWYRPAAGNQGGMELTLVPSTERSRSVEEILVAARQAVADIPAVRARMYPSSSNMMMRMMRGGGERLTVEIRGHDLETADSLSKRVLAAMKGVEGVAHPWLNREDGKFEHTLRVDRRRLAELGLSGADLAATVEAYVLGRVATRYRIRGDEYDVRVQLREADRELIEQLPQLPIVSPQGQVVPLGALATSGESLGPSSISREDQERILSISAATSGRPFGDVARDVATALTRVEVPEGFSVSLGGELEEQREVFLNLLIGVGLALFLVFTVMAIQFESLVQPLIVMTAVPFSLIGVLLVLALTGTTFNMNSFLGLIVLVGIVVNNAIVLVDYINIQRREAGLELVDAIVAAGNRRLRPILMTTLTTALGLVPLALAIGEGSEIQAPLARVVIGGLLTSTAITLLFVPCLYRVVEGALERRRARRRREEPLQGATPESYGQESHRPRLA